MTDSPLAHLDPKHRQAIDKLVRTLTADFDQQGPGAALRSLAHAISYLGRTVGTKIPQLATGAEWRFEVDPLVTENLGLPGSDLERLHTLGCRISEAAKTVNGIGERAAAALVEDRAALAEIHLIDTAPTA